MLAEGIQEDLLDRQSVCGGDRACRDPGCVPRAASWPTVAGAPKTLGFDERLQENGSVAITRLPVLRQLPGRPRKDARREVLAANPRQNQKTSVVDDQMEVPLPLAPGPTDELVSRGPRPSRGTEAQDCQQVRTAVDQVSDLRTRQRLVFQVVIPLDQLVPQR